LKKRTKKLLTLGVRGNGPRTPICKSFLVLFFKKELLPYNLFANANALRPLAIVAESAWKCTPFTRAKA
jgi:hypothetical protein